MLSVHQTDVIYYGLDLERPAHEGWQRVVEGRGTDLQVIMGLLKS